MAWWFRLILAIAVVLLLSEMAPRVVNWLLVLILAGMLIMRSEQLASLVAEVSAVGGTRR